MNKILLLLLFVFQLNAATYPLADGTSVTGEPFSYNAAGLVLRTADGLTPRVPWTNFTKEALQALAVETTDPKKSVFVQNAITPPPPKTNSAPAPPPPQPEKLSVESIRKDPVKIGLAILAVAAVLFILKSIGKVLFGKKPEPAPPPTIKMPVSEEAPPGAIVYRKPEHRFNRRFFEMNFGSFMRVAQPEDGEPKNIIIKSARGTFMGRRITKLTDADLQLQTFKGFATAEELIPLDEIREVQIVPER